MEISKELCGDIDKLWRQFIQESKKYDEYCDSLRKIVLAQLIYKYYPNDDNMIKYVKLFDEKGATDDIEILMHNNLSSDVHNLLHCRNQNGVISFDEFKNQCKNNIKYYKNLFESKQLNVNFLISDKRLQEELIHLDKYNNFNDLGLTSTLIKEPDDFIKNFDVLLDNFGIFIRKKIKNENIQKEYPYVVNFLFDIWFQHLTGVVNKEKMTFNSNSFNDDDEFKDHILQILKKIMIGSTKIKWEIALILKMFII
jgi:hypothetical protein